MNRPNIRDLANNRRGPLLVALIVETRALWDEIDPAEPMATSGGLALPYTRTLAAIGDRLQDLLFAAAAGRYDDAARLADEIAKPLRRILALIEQGERSALFRSILRRLQPPPHDAPSLPLKAEFGRPGIRTT